MKGWLTEKPKEAIRLNIGSGDPKIAKEQYPDIVCKYQDVYPFPDIDLLCDIRELNQFVGEGECEYIMAVHVLEHFGVHEIDGIFSMLFKLIKPGGGFDVIVPNFRYHAGLVLYENNDYQAVEYCFGDQRDEYDFHKTAFTPKILQDRITKAGFQIIGFQEDTSLLANCIKPS